MNEPSLKLDIFSRLANRIVPIRTRTITSFFLIITKLGIIIKSMTAAVARKITLMTSLYSAKLNVKANAKIISMIKIFFRLFIKMRCGIG